ncbi:hypothetical protein [Polaromonas sp.]|nr:hypothetical protein [Polaromonas sp.]NMM07016.1 hypothetical protein [Polaromonas sp.]
MRDITDKRLRRGVFASAAKLKSAIHAYIAMPKPLIWAATVSDIQANVT